MPGTCQEKCWTTCIYIYICVVEGFISHYNHRWVMELWSAPINPTHCLFLGSSPRLQDFRSTTTHSPIIHNIYICIKPVVTVNCYCWPVASQKSHPIDPIIPVGPDFGLRFAVSMEVDGVFHPRDGARLFVGSLCAGADGLRGRERGARRADQVGHAWLGEKGGLGGGDGVKVGKNFVKLAQFTRLIRVYSSYNMLRL